MRTAEEIRSAIDKLERVEEELRDKYALDAKALAIKIDALGWVLAENEEGTG